MKPQKTRYIASVLFYFIAIIFLGGAPPANAQQDSAVSLVARAGLDGYCKDNKWLPVSVTVENQGADLEGFVEVGVVSNGVGNSIYAEAVDLPNGARKQVQLLAFAEGFVSEVAVQYTSGANGLGGDIARVDCLQQGDRLFGLLAGNPSAYSFLNDLDNNNNQTFLAQLNASEFPVSPEGLEALDGLVIANFDTGQLNVAQINAIQQWVTSGGQLVIMGGTGWQKTVEGLGQLMPFTPNGTNQITSFTALERFAPSEDRIEGGSIITTGSPKTGTTALVSQGGQYLVTVDQYGYGEVYFLTFDAAAINGWDSGLINLFSNLFTSVGTQPGWRNGFQNWNNADSAAGVFIDLGLPSFFLICSLLCMYVVVLGPINLIVLQRLGKREWAWGSVPVLVVFFSLLTMVLGSQIRGGQARLNRVAVVQVQPDAEVARVDGLVGIFSPSRSEYEVALNSGLAAHPIPSFSGGGDWRVEGTGNEAVLPNLRVEAGGIERFAVQGYVARPEFAHSLTLRVNNQQIELRGSIHNRSNITLENAVLFYPNNYFEIGDFEAGRQEQVSITISQDDHATYAGLSTAGDEPFQPIYFSQDDVLQALNDGSSYYSDREGFLKQNLINALMQNESSATGRGGGFYLAGWATDHVLDVSLEKSFRAEDRTLYLITLEPEIEITSATVTLSPGLFDWYVLEGQDNGYGEVTPYSMYNYGNSYGLEFKLAQEIKYSSIDSMTLRLIASGGNPGSFGLEVSLWDFSENAWSLLSIDDFGRHEIPSPERFIGPQTTIRMQINDVQNLGTTIQSSDFILVVNP